MKKKLISELMLADFPAHLRDLAGYSWSQVGFSLYRAECAFNHTLEDALGLT